jgi:uroporphyrinogen-III synthase
MKLLIIRPQPGADATAARVKAAGHEALLMPLFEVQPVDWQAPSVVGHDGLLLTSANAVRQAGPQLTSFAHLPVLAVGKVTAGAALKAGLTVSQIGDAGVEALLSHAENHRLLWLAGEDQTDLIAPPTVEVDIRIVYRSAAVPAPDHFHPVISQADCILLHSVRAATYLSAILSDQHLEKAKLSIGALSEGIARAAGGGWKSVRVAPSPNDAALLSCL